MTTFTDYANVTRSMAKSLNIVANEAMTKREIAYFKANISRVGSAGELMSDYRLYSFAMKAFGLEEQIYAKGLMKKVFDGGVTDKNSMANRLADTKYKEIATAFGFAETGNLNMLISSNVDDVVQKYLNQQLEVKEGDSNQGVRLALYFTRMAPNITTWYDVLGDPALAQVVRTAFGLPEEFATADVDKQAAYFESRFKVEDLKDPEKVGKFVQRFTALWDVSGNASDGVDLASAGIAPIQPLSKNGAQIVTIDPALLAQLSQYKL